MSSKILFVTFIFAGLIIASSQPCDAQRRKRGLLSGTEATEEPTDSPDKTTPAATPQPATGGNGSAKKAPTDDGPLDLFELASKTTADKKAAEEKGAAEAKKAKEEGGEVKAPPPELLTLEKDGINVVAALFMSPNAEDPELSKSIVPMILVHDWGGSMNDMGPLAQYLQSVGHTVIVPDLRGHGRSVTLANSPQEIDYRDFNRSQIETIKGDIEECKKQLIDLNNKGQLNISMLSVLAVGDMCPMATEWTLRDWSFENAGRIKQGKDVQSLILVSPPRKFQQMSMTQLVRHPLLLGGGGVEIPTLVVYGEDGNSAKDSSSIYKLMSKKRRPSNASDADVRWAQQSLYELAVPSSGDGAELLGTSGSVFRNIGKFNFYKISRNADNFPWASRE